jgi:FixJ family two-component response regulator
MKVVLIDDDAAVRNSLGLLLTARGHDVDLFAGGQAVLEADLADGSGRFLIADYLMPDIDGLTLLQRLRAQGWLGPALLITGHFNATLEQRALAVGYAEVFEKPLNHERLLDAVARLKSAF